MIPFDPQEKMEADQNQFHQLLTTLLSVDNDTRTQAEDAYKNLPFDTKVTFLLSSIHNQLFSTDLRQMAAVLLRTLFSVEFLTHYRQMTPAAQQELKEQVLLVVEQEKIDTIRHNVCEVAVEVARNLINDGNNEWPEFLLFVFQSANSSASYLKESALRMFTSVPEVFGNQQANYLDLIKYMIQKSLTETSTYEVRFQAVRAVSAFIILHEKATLIQSHFSDLLPSMVQVTIESILKGDDDSLLKCLIDLCETTPKFLMPQLENILSMCMTVVSNENISNSWRNLALEVIVTVAETSAAMRKVGVNHIPLLVPQILKMMTDIEEDPEWSVSYKIVEDGNDSNNLVAEAALYRLICSLGGKTMMPHIEQNIPTMLSNLDWRYRHATLRALSAVGEDCHKQMENLMRQMLNFLQDPHPRVRYAACNTIRQMSTDFAPKFQKKFHEKVVPGLLLVLDDNENPRVQAHAGAALVDFIEDCGKTVLTKYLDAIMAKLESILSTKFKELVEKGTNFVLEQVVTAIATVAHKSEEIFVAYYDMLMPCLKFIIQNANTEELKMLQGKAIECVSLIGVAVGAEKFMNDANEVMAMLLITQTDCDLAVEDPQTSYLISAWARICKILGKQFEQYLPVVMGPVMKAASMKPALLDNDDMEIEGDIDWQIGSLGKQQNSGSWIS